MSSSINVSVQSLTLQRFQFRRSALRILSSSPSAFAYKPRTITSLSQSLLKSRTAPVSLYQRRWASDEVKPDGEVPISTLQATPQEEVENAIHEVEVTQAEEALAQEGAVEAEETVIAEVGEDVTVVNSAEVDAEVAETPIPVAPPAPEAAQAFAAPPRDRPQDRLQRIAEPKACVYVGNLFFDVTEDDLKKEFARFGTITGARLLRDTRGLSKG